MSYLVTFFLCRVEAKLVPPIAEATEQLLGLGTVFYDKWFEGQLNGDVGEHKLQCIYGAKSKGGGRSVWVRSTAKPWTLTELEIIQARKMKLREQGESASDRMIYTVSPMARLQRLQTRFGSKLARRGLVTSPT